MRPKERRDSGQNDLFRARLDQIVDIDHPLAKLDRAIAWRFLEERFGAVYSEKAGHPPLPTRLMAGLSILKHMHDLSDEDLCARWVENLLGHRSCRARRRNPAGRLARLEARPWARFADCEHDHYRASSCDTGVAAQSEIYGPMTNNINENT
jgi:hypothetical protein